MLLTGEAKRWGDESSLFYFTQFCVFLNFSIIKLKYILLNVRIKTRMVQWTFRELQQHNTTALKLILLFFFLLMATSLQYNLHPYNASTIHVQFTD